MIILKNTKKLARVAALLTVLCMISMVMIGGTFAKYTSEYSGQDTALVARWQFKTYEGTTELGAPDASPIKALDLFKHEYGTHINKVDGTDYIIAPGVKDEFTVKMTFLSDVDAKVTVNFTEPADTVADGLPIEYSVDDGTTWVSLAALNNAFVAELVADTNAAAVGTLTAAAPADNTFTFNKSGIHDASAKEISQVVKWRWAFDASEKLGAPATPAQIAAGDAIDTGYGKSSAEGGATRTTYIVNVSVKAEQIQPVTP